MQDFRIETYLAVCSTLNYTKAAKILNITQPAVSQHIKFIEDYYEIKAFRLIGKKMELTEEGHKLLDAFITAKHDDLHLKEIIQSSQNGKKKITFGSTLSICEQVIPVALQKFMNKFPGTDFEVVNANTLTLLQKLNNGEIDFAFVEGYFAKNEFDSLIYSTEPYIAVVRQKHPLLTQLHKEHLVLEDLFSYTLVTREKGSGTREILERSLEERNFSIQDFKTRVEIGNLSVMKSLVMQSDCIMFAYQTVAEKELRNHDLVRLPLEDFSVLHDFTYIWRKNSCFSDYYKELFKIINRTE